MLSTRVGRYIAAIVLAAVFLTLGCAERQLEVAELVPALNVTAECPAAFVSACCGAAAPTCSCTRIESGDEVPGTVDDVNGVCGEDACNCESGAQGALFIYANQSDKEKKRTIWPGSLGQEIAEAEQALVRVVRYLLFERDSLPEVGLASPRALLARSGGTVALSVMIPTFAAAAPYPPEAAGVLKTLTKRVTEATSRMGLRSLAAEHVLHEAKGRGPRRDFSLRAEDGTAIATCTTADMRPRTHQTCTYAAELGIVMKLSYPVRVQDWLEMTVTMRSPRNGNQDGGFTLRLKRQNGILQIISVFPVVFR